MLAGHTERGTLFAFEMVEVGIVRFSRSDAFPPLVTGAAQKARRLPPSEAVRNAFALRNETNFAVFETVEYAEGVRNRFLKR